MQPFDDDTLETNEPNSARMNFRTKDRVKKVIQRAAALSGVDDTAFVTNAAYRAAQEVISAHELTLLQGEDAAFVLDLIDNPPEPTPALAAAYKSYLESGIASK